MGSHHQTASKPAKSDRRVEHHRERQATRSALHVSDLDDVLDPPSVHNNAAPESDWPDRANIRRTRRWKQLLWKGRGKGRQARRSINRH